MTFAEFSESARASRSCFCDQTAFVDSGSLGHAAAWAFWTSYYWLLNTHCVLAPLFMPHAHFCTFRTEPSLWALAPPNHAPAKAQNEQSQSAQIPCGSAVRAATFS